MEAAKGHAIPAAPAGPARLLLTHCNLQLYCVLKSIYLNPSGCLILVSYIWAVVSESNGHLNTSYL
jgi:hypothetical protein